LCLDRPRPLGRAGPQKGIEHVFLQVFLSASKRVKGRTGLEQFLLLLALHVHRAPARPIRHDQCRQRRLQRRVPAAFGTGADDAVKAPYVLLQGRAILKPALWVAAIGRKHQHGRFAVLVPRRRRKKPSRGIRRNRRSLRKESHVDVARYGNFFWPPGRLAVSTVIVIARHGKALWETGRFFGSNLEIPASVTVAAMRCATNGFQNGGQTPRNHHRGTRTLPERRLILTMPCIACRRPRHCYRPQIFPPSSPQRLGRNARAFYP